MKLTLSYTCSDCIRFDPKDKVCEEFTTPTHPQSVACKRAQTGPHMERWLDNPLFGHMSNVVLTVNDLLAGIEKQARPKNPEERGCAKPEQPV